MPSALRVEASHRLSGLNAIRRSPAGSNWVKCRSRRPVDKSKRSTAALVAMASSFWSGLNATDDGSTRPACVLGVLALELRNFLCILGRELCRLRCLFPLICPLSSIFCRLSSDPFAVGDACQHESNKQTGHGERSKPVPQPPLAPPIALL